MDGYAVRTADLATGKAVLNVVEEVLAGQTPRRALTAGQVTRIMTGAPMPAGADAVVPVERTKVLDDGRVAIETAAPKPGLNVLKQGREMRRGDTVLTSGALLRPQEPGLLATVGRPSAYSLPRP